jgi:hypothetical protein
MVLRLHMNCGAFTMLLTIHAIRGDMMYLSPLVPRAHLGVGAALRGSTIHLSRLLRALLRSAGSIVGRPGLLNNVCDSLYATTASRSAKVVTNEFRERTIG